MVLGLYLLLLLICELEVWGLTMRRKVSLGHDLMDSEFFELKVDGLTVVSFVELFPLLLSHLLF